MQPSVETLHAFGKLEERECGLPFVAHVLLSVVITEALLFGIFMVFRVNGVLGADKLNSTTIWGIGISLILVLALSAWIASKRKLPIYKSEFSFYKLISPLFTEELQAELRKLPNVKKYATFEYFVWSEDYPTSREGKKDEVPYVIIKGDLYVKIPDALKHWVKFDDVVSKLEAIVKNRLETTNKFKAERAESCNSYDVLSKIAAA